MMEQALDRGAQIAKARQGAAVQTVVESLTRLLPGARVTNDGSEVVATGKGLLARWLNTAELRFLSSALR